MESESSDGIDSEYTEDVQNQPKWKESQSEKYNSKILKNLTSNFALSLKNEYKNDVIKLWNDIKNKKIIENQLLDGFRYQKQTLIEKYEIEEHYSTLIKAYQSTQNARLKRQYLSLVSNKFMNNSILEVFKCSEWQLRMAQLHAGNFGPGKEIVKISTVRDYLDENLCEDFLDFITSPDYLQTTANSNRIIKVNNDISFISADAIRLATNRQIYNDYKEQSITKNFEHLNESTCNRILKYCKASKLETLQDQYIFH